MKSNHFLLFARYRLKTWWASPRRSKAVVTPAQPQLPRLPEGIKVIRQNTTRPLSMYHLPCPNCGRDVRTSAAFCPNCGVSLASPRPMPKPTIDLQPHALERESDKLPAIPVMGEPDEVSEIVHIDLMLKVKMYLLWDRAGR